LTGNLHRRRPSSHQLTNSSWWISIKLNFLASHTLIPNTFNTFKSSSLFDEKFIADTIRLGLSSFFDLFYFIIFPWLKPKLCIQGSCCEDKAKTQTFLKYFEHSIKILKPENSQKFYFYSLYSPFITSEKFMTMEHPFYMQWISFYAVYHFMLHRAKKNQVSPFYIFNFPSLIFDLRNL
jgi:hypothetical protein